LTETDSLTSLTLTGKTIFSTYRENSKLATINKTKFNLCKRCGYAVPDGREEWPDTHQTPWRAVCDNDDPMLVSLGHEFSTDITEIRLNIPIGDEVTACSTLFALINGLSLAFDIERREIGGCLQRVGRQNVLIIFDRTPGGVGYVRHLANADDFKKVLDVAKKSMKMCDCGDKDGHGACYKCLKSFDNQQFHEILDRKAALDLLSQY